MTALWFCLTPAALADTQATRDGLDRLEELLSARVEEGALSPDDLLPAVVVSARPRLVESEGWFTARALEVLQTSIGQDLRLCAACMAPRTAVEDGVIAFETGPMSLQALARLDAAARGDAAPARTAIWLDEAVGGVSLRIIDLATSTVVYAQNVDPYMTEQTNRERTYTMAKELERRARGDSLTQAFVDVAVYPSQHISLDWTDQWGATNANLSGVTLSIVDPIFGVGAVHYRRMPFLNTLVGAQLIVSLPTAVVQSVADEVEFLDPLLTGVAVARVPFGRSNYGAVATLSTNGRFALGISLLNVSLLPVIP